MTYTEGTSNEEFCPQCDAVQSIVRTVAWQPNQCRECGTEIPESDGDGG